MPGAWRYPPVLLAASLCLGAISAAGAGGDDLVWSTFLGAANRENGYDIAIDVQGAIWVTGFTESDDFPTTAGAFDTVAADGDVFVTRLDPDGANVLLSTLLGGAAREEGYSLSLDGSGQAWVAGYTYSADFPVTPGALDSTLDGDCDAFVAKLDPSGDLVYATLLGGSSNEWCYQIVATDSGQVLAVGSTGSPDFPVTPGAADTMYNGGGDIFVVRLGPSGRTLEYATFLGGGSEDFGWGVAVDDSGSAYVTGYTYSLNFPTTPGAFDNTHMGPTDAFVVRLAPDGSSSRYATLLGGGFRDAARSIAVDTAGCAFVTGYTYSSDFPVTPGSFQDSIWFLDTGAFLTKLDPWGTNLVYSTYLNGDETESGYGIAVNDSGYAWVVGFTESEDFPVTPGSFDETHNGERDIFLLCLDPMGTALSYATFVGGQADDYAWDLALQRGGRVFFTGFSRSGDFPSTPGAFQEGFGGMDDVIVAGLLPGGQVPVTREAGPSPIPGECRLYQNWPNPFNAATTIRFQLPSPGTAQLTVYNAAGQRVRRLAGGPFTAGEHSLVWNGRDDEGQKAASGVYFCRLEDEHPGSVSTVKMLLLR